MADIELVIKIPKEMWERVKEGYVPLGISKYLRSGIPLPKGHGRLKDVDWIDDNCLDYRTDDDGSWCYKWRDIDNAPTIVEADKE